MIVPKDFRHGKPSVLVYLNEYFDSNQLNKKFDVNAAMIYNPCFPMLSEVVNKLKDQGLEIRVIVKKEDYECVGSLKNIDFDVLELRNYEGEIKIKQKALACKRFVEIYIDSLNEKDVNRWLWNLQEISKVFLKKSLEGKIKVYENVKFI